jgi:hypothetical protein
MKKSLIFSTLFALLAITNCATPQKLTIASGNIMHEFRYAAQTEQSKRMPLKRRTKRFKNFLKSKEFAKADITFFYGWPNPKLIPDDWIEKKWITKERFKAHNYQSKEWNTVLKSLDENGYETHYSGRLEMFGLIDKKNRFISDGVAVAIKTSETKFDFIEQDKFSYTKVYKLPEKLSPLGENYGDAIAVVVKPKNSDKKIGVIGCQFEKSETINIPQYHFARQEQVKKIMHFKNLIDIAEKYSIDSWIICGDLEWDCKTSFYYKKYITQSFPKIWIDVDKKATELVTSQKTLKLNTIIKDKVEPTKRVGQQIFNRIDYMFYQNGAITLDEYKTFPENKYELIAPDIDVSKGFSDHSYFFSSSKFIFGTFDV